MLVFVFLFVLIGSANAQKADPLLRFDVFQEVNLTMDFDLASYLNNNMIASGLLSNRINNTTKNKNADLLDTERNPFGNTIDMALQYRQKPNRLFNRTDLGYSAAVEYHSLIEMDFTKDAFSLLFYGNKMFAGQYANLSNMEYNSLQYYQIKGGLFKQNRDKNLEFGFQFNFNIGNSFAHYQSLDAQLFTDSLGLALNLEGNFSASESEYTASSFSKIQGLGVGIDLFYARQNPGKWELRLEMKNLGFIRWNKQGNQYDQHENLTYSGFEIDNIFQMPNPIISTTLEDTLRDFLDANGTKSAYTLYTPATIQVFYKKMLKPKFGVYTQLNHRFNSLYRTNYALGASYTYNPQLVLDANINYGGYTKLNIGVGFAWKINTKFVLELKSRYLSGFFSQKFSGIGTTLSINYKI
jgi:hypothetical protein